MKRLFFLFFIVPFIVLGCEPPVSVKTCGPKQTGEPAEKVDDNGETPGSATPEALEEGAVSADDFIVQVEKELLVLWSDEERAAWVNATYITADTDKIKAAASARLMAFISEKAALAKTYEGQKMSDATRRKLKLLKLSLNLPAPNDSAERAELAKLSAEMKSHYGKAAYCEPQKVGAQEGDGGQKCSDLQALSSIIGTSTDYDALLAAWQQWRETSKVQKKSFVRFVELANKGAQDLGFEHVGDLWNARYDMSPEDFSVEIDRLYTAVQPLYEQLHCYAKGALQSRYGKKHVPDNGPIPAHLFGNMWAQNWSHLDTLLVPKQWSRLDLTAKLKKQAYTPEKMVRQAESFFVSLGLSSLPKTFYERSMFEKPRDRDVVCHASAWHIDWKDDVRIKMCIDVAADDFKVIHHELGHNYYYLAYNDLDPLFTDSANDGFHEAIGDTISLSVTPKYLKEVGIIDVLPKDDLTPLLKQALRKIAFLPFGLLVDKWRDDVFSGKISPDKYNQHWWDLRKKYQGIVPPVARAKDAFDPGAKYHVPANVPYTRYFLATILQFQFHQSLCETAGHSGPLHTCSIYGDKKAGERLQNMLKMGLRKPWPNALAAITGESQMDPSALIAYFEPLMIWLKEQNKDRTCGW